MYLASFRYQERDFLGIRWGENQLLPVSDLLGPPSNPDAMLDLIEKSATLLPAIQRATAGGAGVVPIPVDAVKWHPPVRRPGKIVGVAMNNSASDARKISAPKHPMFFLKPRSSLL